MKVTLVGDKMVGKTNLLFVRVGEEFQKEVSNPVPEKREVQVDALGKQIKLRIADTRGSFDFDKLRPLAYPHTCCFMICFSVVCPKSFENIEKKWIPEIAKYCPNAPFVLVGTKTDLRNDDSPVVKKLRDNNMEPISTGQGEQLANQYNTSYWETSALLGDGLQHPFNAAIATSVETLLYSAQTGWETAPARQGSGTCSLQ